MDIENTSDQQSTRETLDSGVESAQLLMTALQEMLQKLQEMGLDKEQEITIRVGSSKIYDGTIGGSGDQPELTEAQSKTLREAFDPANGSGSVRVIDKDNNLLFQSKNGQILKNELSQVQKQAESATVKSEPVVSKPEVKNEKPTQSTEVSSTKLDLSKGQIPTDIGIPQLKGVDPNKFAEVDRDLAISWGVALEKVATINESRASVGDNNPAISGLVKSLEETRDSIEKQIETKGYTNEQLLGKPSQTESVNNSQSRDIPSLDNAPSEPNQSAENLQSNDPPVQADRELPSQDLGYESPTGKVLDKIDNSPGLSEPAPDPIFFQNQINREHPQEQAAIPRDPLEELGQIAISQAEQIAELQSKLSEVSGKLEELTAWKENLTPMKLANERVGNWLNQQRDKMASKVHGLANQIAGTATQKFEQVKDQVYEKVDQGLERHSQAVEEVKNQVTDKVGEVRNSLENQFTQAQDRHNQALGKAGQQAAETFMTHFVEPTAKMLISQMERVNEVKTQEDGTKSFETDSISWNVKPDGTTSLTRKADGQKIEPSNVTAGEMKTINSTVQAVSEKYGFQPTQSQAQSVSLTQEPKKAVQKV